jgi:ABC-2 type transport system ATP-binding protein
MNVLEAQGVNKKFEHHQALTDVSISIPKGSIYGLLGPNGAGKTTFIRIINQIIGLDSGEVFIDGQALHPDHIKTIGYLPEERGLYKKMKVGEQAIYLAMLKGMRRTEAIQGLKHWFDRFEIMAWWDKRVEELSKGMQQKIQFIVTILHKPKLLIFDEPFSGFDPINTNLLKQEILNLRKEGATIIFSTHNMASVEEICDRIALINKSKVILEGKVNEIKDQHRTSIYEIEYQPFKDSLIEKIPSNFDILEKTDTSFGRKIKVNIKNSAHTNTLLDILMNNARIIRFQEVVPSMNDIFIKMVNSSSNLS